MYSTMKQKGKTHLNDDGKSFAEPLLLVDLP